jgi:vesicle coat complex subunit
MEEREIRAFREGLDANDSTTREKAARRVIAAVRAGENLGCLFTSMLRCVHTDSIELKRLVYLYLVTYSSQEPEQSIMAVNTFIKDSEDRNPIIRALAVRTMCRVKLDTVAEYMIVPLKKCLTDPEPYVRKTAALAVGKLYDVIPELIENSDLLSVLVKCLYDENPMVISNATVALFEVNERRSTPYFALNEETVTPIISALNQCSDWVLVVMFDALSKYDPPNPQEASFLIDRMITYLKHSNPAVVIGSFKCIFKYIPLDGRDQQTLFSQIIPPIITLTNTADHEIKFVVLRTLSLFVVKYPRALAREIRVFCCKYNEPSYVKKEKLEILVTIASVINVHLIIGELSEYCNSVDVGFVRKTIASLGQICLKIPSAARRCIDILMALIESKADYAIEESVCVIADILRCFPGEFESIIGKVCRNMHILKVSRAKAAAIWILGEYSHLIDQVDLIIDPFLDTFHDESPDVQVQLVAALVKVFVTKPEIGRDQLQFILTEATKESVMPDVRGRAYFYWRLLSSDQAAAKSALLFTKEAVAAKSDSWDDGVLGELIQNMGSVSGILHVLPRDFVSRTKFLPEDDEEEIGESRVWLKVSINDDDLEFFYNWTKARLWLKFANKSPMTFGLFAVAFDRNCIGAEIAGSLSFPAQLEFGDSFELEVPLRFSDRFVSQANDARLQVAVRTSAGVKYLAIPIDLAAAIQPAGELGEERFALMWGQTQAETQIRVPDARAADQKTLSARALVWAGGPGGIAQVGFCLPPSYFYCANIAQAGTDVSVVVRGDPKLFPAIEQSALGLFCA